VVRKEVGRRIEKSHVPQAKVSQAMKAGKTNNDLKDEYAWLFQQPAHVIAQNLKRMNRLSAQVIVNALEEGDYDFVIAGLAELAELTVSVGQRMIAMRSARGVAALCWKAGGI